MKTDLYTKIVLTVIAIALVGHLVKDMDFVTKATASPLPQPTEAQSSGVVDVNIVKIDGNSIGYSTPISVKIK